MPTLFKIQDADWAPSEVANLIVPIGSEYLESDIISVLGQEGCVAIGIQPRKIIKLKKTMTKDEIQYNKSRYFIVGKDKDGNWMQNNGNLVAAPCPDICGIGK